MKLKKKGLFSSLSSTINAFYILLIVLFVVLTGSILYFVANNQIYKNTETNMQQTLDQKLEYLSFLYRDIFEQFYFLTQNIAVEKLNDSIQSSPQSYLSLTEEVEFFYNRNSNFIDSIYINLGNDAYLITESTQQEVSPSFQKELYYSFENETNEGYFWLNNHEDPIFDQSQDVQSIVYLLNGNQNSLNGLMVVNLKTSFIQNILQDTSMDGGYMMLVDPKGYLVPEEVEENQELNQRIFNLFKEDSLNEQNQEISLNSKEKYWLRNGTVGTNKWELVFVSPKTSLLQSTSVIFLIFLLISLILSVSATFFLQIVRRYISAPIKNLAESMLTTETYHEKLKWSKDVPEELAVLYESYNTLTDRNIHLIEQMTAQQEEKKDLEVALLHAQINPHFLYNTLYSIKGLCEMGENEEASEMISKLSDFFRTSLSKGEEIITIEEEIKNIKSYLYIMEMRYGDFFSYEINVSKELYSYEIVKLSLQPIVENAIYHGVMQNRQKGLLIIEATELENSLLFCVRDNGAGIEDIILEKINREVHTPLVDHTREETGVGLRSVNIRIKNRYGNKYGIRIESIHGEYTEVFISIPKTRGEKNV
ncbi:histidine kinase [Jeotgalibaca sp. MA1X17-3]|uniref:sensor histidine kinase n=1 Tax=Jeotgalibaca sp. MA1X17-3 TaxID=2908211 RepID=UPI001F1BCB70|nr:histidine kinase [Jeotgalibaca sp. MA1X17-3]UJF15662.1 histidine kinase [Jeotgalibaca sp. MA1X17-3]